MATCLQLDFLSVVDLGQRDTAEAAAKHVPSTYRLFLVELPVLSWVTCAVWLPVQSCRVGHTAGANLPRGSCGHTI